MSLPLLKVGTLLLKTLAKPVANSIKSRAQNPGGFRDACVWFGQNYHKFSQRLTLRMQGHHTLQIKPIPPEKALQVGAAAASESFVFAVALAAFVGETMRKNALDDEKAAQKAADERAARAALLARLESIEVRLCLLEEDLDRERVRGTDFHDVVTRAIQQLDRDIRKVGGGDSSAPPPGAMSHA